MIDSTVTDFPTWAKVKQSRIEEVLDEALPPADQEPQKLHNAMRYSALGGGKRWVCREVLLLSRLLKGY